MGKHSIIVIKKGDKYLQYFDKDWDSFLFPNCKMENEDSISNIKEYLKNLLELEDIQINYVGKKEHSKFSEKHKKVKQYEHYFYLVKINNLPHYLEKNEFEINSNIFKWFSYKELLTNERIQKVNSDIVDFIGEFKI